MEIKKIIKKGKGVVLFLIFALAFWLRTYRLDYPLADWHSWRQADTAAVTRNFIKEGLSPLYPKFDSLWALNNYGPENTNRYFFAEFPLYNLLVYPLYRLWGTKIVYSRLVSIFFSSLTTVSLFFLVESFSGGAAAFLAALVFAVLPYNVYYGRVVMPDPLHVFCGVTALTLLRFWQKTGRWSFLLTGGLFLAAHILTKPYGLILGAVVGGFLLLQKKETLWQRRWQIIVLGIVSLTPYLLWRWHISHYPEGQFGTDWLFNSTRIRFRPAFFRWLFYERLTKIILGGGGLALFVGGWLAEKTKEEWVFYSSWMLGLLVFVSVIATGNVTHDYYQLPWVPLLASLVGKGSVFFYRQGEGFLRKGFNAGVVLCLWIMMIGIGWYETKGFWNVNNWAIVKAGKAADQLLPADAKVIAPYNRDSTFLYQTNRIGWPFVPEEIEKMVARGADYYISVNFDDLTKRLMEKCQIVAQEKDWVIIDLHQCEKKK
ncbi:glycosyltransferase family 39 protein [bacterium]|nr:glycosyltransferase family 39 protein [bacterium]